MNQEELEKRIAEQKEYISRLHDRDRVQDFSSSARANEVILSARQVLYRLQQELLDDKMSFKWTTLSEKPIYVSQCCGDTNYINAVGDTDGCGVFLCLNCLQKTMRKKYEPGN